jgi:hypothetical protein
MIGSNLRIFRIFKTAAQIAQLVEHATENRSVTGSIPVLGTISLQVSCYFLPVTMLSSKLMRNGASAALALRSAVANSDSVLGLAVFKP